MNIQYTRDALEKIQALVHVCENEIGWVGLGDVQRGPHNRIVGLVIEDILVPPQEVTSVTVDLDDDALAKACHMLVESGRSDDLQRVIYWGHSHVNMGVSPSNVDKEAWRDWMVGADQTRVLCAAIFNKKGESYHEVRVYNPEVGDVYWEKLGYSVISDNDWTTWAKQEIDEKLEVRNTGTGYKYRPLKPKDSQRTNTKAFYTNVDADDDLLADGMTLKEWRMRFNGGGYV